MGIGTLYRKRRTSLPDKKLTASTPTCSRGAIERPNQVWACDISYLPMAKGFVYLGAILDFYSRKVMAWRTSNTSSTDFCVEALIFSPRGAALRL